MAPFPARHSATIANQGNMPRPTLVDQMQEQSDAEEARRMNWSSELKKHWYVYAFLLLLLWKLNAGRVWGLEGRLFRT